MRRIPALALGLVLLAADASAWTGVLVEALCRDARRLVPPTLSRLIGEREAEVLQASARLPPAVLQPLSRDLFAGELRPATLATLDAQLSAATDLLRQGRLSEGVVRLGALLRVPADLSDPVLSAGVEGYPPGVTREYYAFVEASLGKIPVVLSDAPALKLDRSRLPGYWRRLLAQSRSQSPVVRSELFQSGRLVSHRDVDYRSPVFGVASLSYSRAVTGIAATWLAVWREARGDLTRMAAPETVVPRDRGPETTDAGRRP